MAIEITSSTIKEYLNGDKLLVVDFWAPWCGPCKAIAPVIEELAKDYEGQAVIGKCDVDENPDLSEEYGIRNIPTILFFKNGKLADKQVGAVTKSVLVDKITQLI